MSIWTLSDGTNCIQNGIPTLSCIKPLFEQLLAVAVNLIGVVALFLIMAAGIKFITSGGGKGVEEAKNMLTYAIIGLLVVFFAYFIISLISGITGIDCFLSFGFSSCQ